MSSLDDLVAFGSQSPDLFASPVDTPRLSLDRTSQPRAQPPGFNSSELFSDTATITDLTALDFQPPDLFCSGDETAVFSHVDHISPGYTHTEPQPEPSRSIETLSSQPQHHLNHEATEGISGSTDHAHGLARGSSSRLTNGREASNIQVGGWRSPLHIAAYKGHDRIVKLLVRHDGDCNEKDSDGTTPLIHAVKGGYEDVVSTLLQHAARVSETDALGRSSIHWAVFHQRGAIMNALLENCHGLNAAVNTYDNNGQTPLHMAIDVGFEEGVQVLLRYGANMCLRSLKIK